MGFQVLERYILAAQETADLRKAWKPKWAGLSLREDRR